MVGKHLALKLGKTLRHKDMKSIIIVKIFFDNFFIYIINIIEY